MTEKYLKSRIVLKHDTEANWQLAVNFTPLKGEMIVYDIDENYSYERLKVGDGVTNVNDLPFLTYDIATDDEVIDMLIQNNLLSAVADADGTLLSTNGSVILW